MSSPLTEGQSFPPRHRLDKKISRSDAYESWVATNEQTGDRVFVRVLLTQPVESDWQTLTDAVDAVRGLVHQNINLVREHGSADNLRYLVEPYIKGGKPFEVSADKPWPALKQTIEALQYIHNLGISHGNIHPHNLVVDQNGTVHLTGIGIAPKWSSDSKNTEFLSPQMRAGNVADATDDIYSLGCLIYSVLTGRIWQAATQPSSPLPDDIEHLLSKMMSESPFDRNIQLSEIQAALADHFDDADTGIHAVDFSRPGAKTEAEPQAIAPVASRQSKAVSTQTVILGFGSLAVIAALLFYLLPDPGPVIPSTISQQHSDQSAQTSQPSSQQATQPAPRIAPFEAARLEFMQQEGEKVARDILRLQLALEDQGVMLWANEEFQASGNELEAADEAFREGNLESALGIYESIAVSLAALRERIPAELELQTSRGDDALDIGDDETALTAFTIASVIHPRDPDLKAKLSRAENLGEVLSLMRQGEMLEREAQIEDALTTYLRAQNLDSQWQPASEAIARIRIAIMQRSFQQSMSLAFQATATKDYELARSHFARAQEILPNSPEPADGVQQVNQAETRDAIDALRIEAETFMTDNAWQSAIGKYQEVLAISNSLEFATQGLEQAEWRLDLETRLQRYLVDPPLLQSDIELKSASATLRDAMKVDSPSPELLRRIDSLAKLISTARIEIPVTITSDSKTTVTVRKHAKLGLLASQIIYLIPGRYTITGEREGYRDVREDLVLIAGRPVPEISIASNERVR